MNVTGIGIDISDIERVRGQVGLAKRILSKKEFALYEKNPDPDSFLSGRFALKEAYVKASGNKDVNFADLEALDDATGKPHLYLRGREVQGLISLAHDKEAVAVVLLFQDEKDPTHE
ncbi:MAG: holo-ACP synthase [Bacilli bacterium]|jgi:holo-[acyl-carrier protein] synthase|nr:holo-ACP synthase [Bacilli bacterium]